MCCDKQRCSNYLPGFFLSSFLCFVFVGVREGVEHQAWNWFLIAWCSGPLGFSRVRELFKEKKQTTLTFLFNRIFSVKMGKNNETFQSSFRNYFEG